MPRSRVRSRLHDLIDQIGQVRLEGDAKLGVIAELRAELGLDFVMYFRFVQRARGWTIEGFESDGFVGASTVRRPLGEYLATSDKVPWLALTDPPPSHRNKAIIITDEAGQQIRSSEFYQQVVPPELGAMNVVRVLLWEDDKLRGWLGGFSSAPISEEQRAMLEALVEPLLVRMRIERSLAAAPRIHAGIEQTMQFVRAPAVLVDARGRVHASNRAASLWTASEREAVLAEIAAVLSTRRPSSRVTVQSAGMSEGTERFLAILAARSDDERREQAAALAGLRWQLTPRETHILKRIVDGATTAEIASELQVDEQDAEQKIAAIFNRARVTNRSQLVAAVLQG